jgi:hypothetical protein
VHLYSPDALPPLQAVLLSGIGSSNDEVIKFCTNACSSLMRTLVRRHRNEQFEFDEDEKGGSPPPFRWPDLLPKMEVALRSTDLRVRTGSLRLAAQLTEDLSAWLAEQPSKPLNFFVEGVYSAAASRVPGAMQHAVTIASQLTLLPPEDLPSTLLAAIPEWIDLLIAAGTHCESPQTRTAAVEALERVFTAVPAKVYPHLTKLVDFFFKACDDLNITVSAVAIDFWSELVSKIHNTNAASHVYVEDPAAVVAGKDTRPLPENQTLKILEPLLPRLIELLVRKLALTSADAAELPVDDVADSLLPDAGAPLAGAAGVSKATWVLDEDTGEDGSLATHEGTLTPRKSSMDCIGILCKYLGKEFTARLWPEATKLLGAAGPEGWQSRVAGLAILELTLSDSLSFYRSKDITSLLPWFCDLSGSDERPLVRAGCVSVLQAATELVAAMAKEATDRVLSAVMSRVRDKSKYVQSIAIRCLGKLLPALLRERKLEPELLKSVVTSLASFMPILPMNSRKYASAIFASIAEADDGALLRDPAVLDSILSCLVEWWKRRPSGGALENDMTVRYILESLQIIIPTVGPAAAPYVGDITSQCMKILDNVVVLVVAAQAANESTHGIVNADMAIDVLTDCLTNAVVDRRHLESFLTSSSYLSHLAQLVSVSDDLDVLEAVMGSYGELVTLLPAVVVPQIQVVWTQFLSALHPDYGAAASNTAWTITQCFGAAVTAFVPVLAVVGERCCKILTGKLSARGRVVAAKDATKYLYPDLAVNVGVLLARCYSLDPSFVAGYLSPDLVVNWTFAATMNENVAEKLATTMSIVKCLSEAGGKAKDPRLLLSMATLTSSWHALLPADAPREQVDFVRSACSGLFACLGRILSPAEWAAGLAMVSSEIIRGRVNAVVGSAVFPL